MGGGGDPLYPRRCGGEGGGDPLEGVGGGGGDPEVVTPRTLKGVGGEGVTTVSCKFEPFLQLSVQVLIRPSDTCSQFLQEKQTFAIQNLCHLGM